jgi:hypothetical protein
MLNDDGEKLNTQRRISKIETKNEEREKDEDYA